MYLFHRHQFIGSSNQLLDPNTCVSTHTPICVEQLENIVENDISLVSSNICLDIAAPEDCQYADLHLNMLC